MATPFSGGVDGNRNLATPEHNLLEQLWYLIKVRPEVLSLPVASRPLADRLSPGFIQSLNDYELFRLEPFLEVWSTIILSQPDFLNFSGNL